MSQFLCNVLGIQSFQTSFANQIFFVWLSDFASEGQEAWTFDPTERPSHRRPPGSNEREQVFTIFPSTEKHRKKGSPDMLRLQTYKTWSNLEMPGFILASLPSICQSSGFLHSIPEYWPPIKILPDCLLLSCWLFYWFYCFIIIVNNYNYLFIYLFFVNCIRLQNFAHVSWASMKMKSVVFNRGARLLCFCQSCCMHACQNISCQLNELYIFIVFVVQSILFTSRLSIICFQFDSCSGSCFKC